MNNEYFLRYKVFRIEQPPTEKAVAQLLEQAAKWLVDQRLWVVDLSLSYHRVDKEEMTQLILIYQYPGTKLTVKE